MARKSYLCRRLLLFGFMGWVDAEAAQFAVEVGAVHPYFVREFGDVAVAVAEVFEQVLALKDFARVPEGHVFRDDL